MSSASLFLCKSAFCDYNESLQLYSFSLWTKKKSLSRRKQVFGWCRCFFRVSFMCLRARVLFSPSVKLGLRGQLKTSLITRYPKAKPNGSYGLVKRVSWIFASLRICLRWKNVFNYWDSSFFFVWKRCESKQVVFTSFHKQ